MTDGVVSAGRRLTDLAARRPDEPVVVLVREDGSEEPTSRLELERTANRLARLLASRGAGAGSMVVVGLPNCAEHVAAAFAAWKLGACVLPLSWRLPERERERVLELAAPAAVVAEWGLAGEVDRAEIAAAEATVDAEPLPDVVAAPGKAIASGGSTGAPKIIVDPRPQARVPERENSVIGRLTGIRPRQVQLVTGPLYHNGPFGACHHGLFEGHRIVLMERFDAARAVALLERHRVNWVYLVPTMMRRMIQVPAIHDADLSSLEAIYHTAAPCPPTLKRAWIELLGGERVYEAFGATEEVGLCAIRGDEWLEHPGSVGRPVDTDVLILDELGEPSPAGVVGEIYMRRQSPGQTYYYLGADRARVAEGGFASVGDMGWLDEDGYLYLADRRADMIVSGGANVYPAEVEAALLEHPEVADVAVVGLPDEEWGKRVHAVVQPRDPAAPPPVEELEAHCRERLVSYKVPKSWDFVPQLPRDEAGKLRRAALV